MAGHKSQVTGRCRRSRLAAAVLLLPLLCLLGCAARVAAQPAGRGPAGTASVEVQEKEREALLALAGALQPESLSSNLWTIAGWLPSDGGANPPPCADPPWRFVKCSGTKRVAQLDISKNATKSLLSGQIPWASLPPLRRMTRFNAAKQAITGPSFPEDMPRMPGLTILDLAYNQLSSFTEQVGQLPNLMSLNLYGQRQMGGSYPVNVSRLTGLVSLSLGYNSISSPIPSQWSTLERLVYLQMQEGQATGELPSTLSTLTRLSFLNLARNNLTGGVPSSWGSLNASLVYFSVANNLMNSAFPTAVLALTKLTKMDLSTNKFNGPVPAALWTWNAADLDISNNYFNGSVPAKRENGTRFVANCFNSSGGSNATAANALQRTPSVCESFYQSLYPAPAPPPSLGVSVGMILGIAAAATALCILLGLLLFYHFQQRDRLAKRLRKGTTQSTREFSLSELKTATKNWNSILGRGGYGTVYKAVLRDGTIVAVKRLDQVSDQGDQEFIREVELLSRVHHRHLVNLIGFCGEKGERALVYEYMGLGSLYEHLHGECAQEQPLSWDSRIKIAIHVACGIDYLHYGADPPLIHRDIKSGNILLSEDGYAKVADFGLCKEAPVGVAVDGTAQLVPPATEVRGSFGYLDPEYVNTSVLSEKSDVYSYGVVLLELITGKKSIHDWQPLAYWAEPYLEDPNRLEDLVDPALEEDYDDNELQILCDIARSCVYDQAAMRPAIRDVAQALVENLGRVVSSAASESVMDRSTLSSELASSSDPNDTPSGMSQSLGTPSEYSFRNANSEALMTRLEKDQYLLATGPDGTKPPVPVGKNFKDTI